MRKLGLAGFLLALATNAHALQIADGQYAGSYNDIDLGAMQVAFNSISAKESGGVDVGMVVVWNRAENPLNWEKWMECNGASAPDEQAKLLNSDMCKDYHICTVPDYRGLFLRGHGQQVYSQNNGSIIGVTATTHKSGDLGKIQGDATRQITGSVYGVDYGSHYALTYSGILYQKPEYTTGCGHEDANNSKTYLDNGRMVPIANEIRPANMAVRYLIRINE